VFRPRGFSPPRRFAPLAWFQVYCNPVPERVRRVSRRPSLPPKPKLGVRRLPPPFPTTRFAPFEEYPSPVAVPHHCGRCLPAVCVLPHLGRAVYSALPQSRCSPWPPSSLRSSSEEHNRYHETSCVPTGLPKQSTRCAREGSATVPDSQNRRSAPGDRQTVRRRSADRSSCHHSRESSSRRLRRTTTAIADEVRRSDTLQVDVPCSLPLTEVRSALPDSVADVLTPTCPQQSPKRLTLAR